jgi:hypothetical protein
MVMETKASKADRLRDLYGGIFFALLVGVCAAIVNAVFLLNSGRTLIVALVSLALAVALMGNILAYVLDLRSGGTPRIIAGIFTAVILTAGIVAVNMPTQRVNAAAVPEPTASAMMPTQRVNAAAGPEPTASAMTGPRPSPTPKVKAKPVNQEAVCGNRPRPAHFLVYDTKTWEIKTGPRVKKKEKGAILNELQQRVCADPALLFDLLTYHKYGIDSPVTAENRLREIRRLTDNRAEWDSQVELLLVLVRRGNPQIEVTGGSYTTWWHSRGNSRADIPELVVGDLRGFSSSYVVYETAAGGVRRLRLNCGFQPFEE